MTAGTARQRASEPGGADAGGEGADHLLRDEYGALSFVRCLHSTLAADPVFQRDYPVETAALADLDERRVAVPDRYVVNTSGHIIAVIRPHFDGAPLSALLARRVRGLDPQTAATVVADVLAGLRALHGRGVSHRQVTSDRVLVSADGLCVLVDAGLVARGGGPGEADPARPGVAYPAVAMAEDLAAVSDLFAECVAHESLLAGLSPPGAGPPVPDGASDVLHTMLARIRRPDLQGPYTAEDLLAALDAATAGLFDAGWGDRGRERLAALVVDSRQSPTRLREMLSAWGDLTSPARRSHASRSQPVGKRLAARWSARQAGGAEPAAGPGPGHRADRRADRKGAQHGRSGRTPARRAVFLITMVLVTLATAGLTALLLAALRSFVAGL